MEHVDPTGPLFADDLNKKKEHNQAMLEIASTLNYAEYDDIKEYDTAFKMWKDWLDIYGGDQNV